MASSANCPCCSFPGTEHTRSGIPSSSPDTHFQSPTVSATRYVDIFGVVENWIVCFPAGPGWSLTILPFEIAVSSLSTTAVISNVALYAGSSNDGNATRASTASNCVTAYFRWFASLRYMPRSLLFNCPT